MNDYYVYVIFRPHGVPCYVGKGRGDRWKAHLQRCRGRNPHLVAIFDKAGGALPTVKVREGLTNSESSVIEIALIKAIGREVHGGPLVNQTDGGEGSPGYRFTPEQRAAMSLARKGKPSPPGTGAKIAAAHRGQKRSKEARANISRSQMGKVHSPEAREKNRIAHIGFRHTEEARAKITAAGIGRKKSPGSIEKTAASKRGIPRPEEVRIKLRNANLGKTHTPETRALLAEKSRIAWLSRPRKSLRSITSLE